MAVPPPPTVCGAEIPIPAARCTLPRHHSGTHVTAEIPEVLSGVAAEMLMETSRLQHAVREYQLRARAARVALVLFVCAGATFIGSAAWMIAQTA